jgi:hypothetical protein
MTADQLPVTKAGGKVGLLVDSVGPITSLNAVFPYLGLEATVHKIEGQNTAGSRTNRWLIEFWTEASLDICPDGTIVGMDLTGTSPEGDTRLSTISDPKYAAGVVKTMGSVYEDWFVVLQGRD